jgi:hypothetical protein
MYNRLMEVPNHYYLENGLPSGEIYYILIECLIDAVVPFSKRYENSIRNGASGIRGTVSIVFDE